jgi:hypothetical protein
MAAVLLAAGDSIAQLKATASGLHYRAVYTASRGGAKDRGGRGSLGAGLRHGEEEAGTWNRKI